jgi:formimidoylglutamate deiminase
MLKAGYTAVCEFHYLHNQPDGTAYDERATMSQALIDAASTAGIGLTLLPTLYQTSDFAGAPPTQRQRQFVLATDQYLELIDGLSRVQSPQVEIGIALHSLRAVPADALRTVLTSLPSIKTIHIHIAEQDREVTAAQQHLGARPIEWLIEHARVDRRWCLVHATHSTHAELKAVAAAGAVIGLCPTTEANLGDGSFALPFWLASHGTFAIGSDSHISLSPIEELRWLEYQARLTSKHRNVLATDNEPSSGSMLWRHACAAGTRATARNIGAIEAGRRADIVVLDTNGPLFVGRQDDELMDTFVFAGSGHEVRDVMVAGRWLVQEGRHFAETAIAAGYKRAMTRILQESQ